jgi:hypothetical protein
MIVRELNKLLAEKMEGIEWVEKKFETHSTRHNGFARFGLRSSGVTPRVGCGVEPRPTPQE